MQLKVWGDTARDTKSKALDKYQSMVEAEKGEFLNYVQQSLAGLVDKYKGYPVLWWFLHGLQRETNKGAYAYLSCAMLSYDLRDEAKRKVTMKWSVVGWIAYNMIRENYVEESSFMFSRVAPQFQTLVNEVVPRFVYQLSDLDSMKAGQLQRVADMKNRSLAAITAAFMAIAQVGGNYMARAYIPAYIRDYADES